MFAGMPLGAGVPQPSDRVLDQPCVQSGQEVLLQGTPLPGHGFCSAQGWGTFLSLCLYDSSFIFLICIIYYLLSFFFNIIILSRSTGAISQAFCAQAATAVVGVPADKDQALFIRN